ncbi:transcriptional regulator [Bifidobacterium sp. UTCIF-37]|uniref:response regulator transcription factor n=1 Tax=unclassified Bifidobacterium TaxID=2608897 RepID=UPI001129FA33|nr:MULTISPECIES: response regulator transcription factor [unclassified Bifidobacterium]TPF86324.1 transcriptional regulator [Bifidobacterium sp. UTCIF-37]TPF88784.1 transcriptional regulator [Bifidobacterium sp. UTCIF-38]
MRILIVEDDRELAAALDDALRYEGYATDVAMTGVEALKALADTDIDIVLLDRDLPVLSGDAVMATIAANRIPVAVIMLTAATDVSDRVSGLDLGADDYLTKPFAYPELLARIRALQRRTGKSIATAAVLTRGDLTLDTMRRLVFRDHGRTLVKLTPKEYGVLLELMRADGGYVSVDELHRSVWDAGPDVEAADVVKTTMYSLRRKLEDRDLIVSARGEGYRLA